MYCQIAVASERRENSFAVVKQFLVFVFVFVFVVVNLLQTVDGSRCRRHYHHHHHHHHHDFRLISATTLLPSSSFLLFVIGTHTHIQTDKQTNSQKKKKTEVIVREIIIPHVLFLSALECPSDPLA